MKCSIKKKNIEERTQNTLMHHRRVPESLRPSYLNRKSGPPMYSGTG